MFLIVLLLLFTTACGADDIDYQCRQSCVFQEIGTTEILSNCSSRAKKTLKKQIKLYQKELNRCHVEQSPTAEPTSSPIDIDFSNSLQKWERNLKDVIEYHYLKPYQTGTSRYNDEHYNIIYYEGGWVFKQASNYFQRQGNLQLANKAESISQKLARAYQNIAWPNYRTGSQWAFAKTASLVSDSLLLDTAENNAYWYNDGLVDALNANDARGLAYYLASLSLLKQKNIKVTRGHQLEDVANAVKAYIATYPHRFDLFYMNAMLGNIILEYREQLQAYLDPELEALKIAEMIKPYVNEDGSIKYGIGDHVEANETYKELNLIIAALFQKLGDSETARKLFIYGVTHADLETQAKAVSQNYLYSFEFVKPTTE